MGDPARPLAHAKEQIVILAAVQPGSEAPDRVEKSPAEHREMRDVVHGQQQVGVPVGLEERLDASTVRIELVLVRIDEVEVRLLAEARHDFEERFGRERVVVIEQRHEVPRGLPERVVGSAGNAFVPREVLHPHPAFCRGVLVENVADVRPGRAIVDEMELPRRIDLGAYGLDGFPEPDLVGVVDRHDHADGRVVRQLLHCHLHRLDIFRCEAVPLDPDLVLQFGILRPLRLGRSLDEELLSLPSEANLVLRLRDERSDTFLQQDFQETAKAPVKTAPQRVLRHDTVTHPTEPLEDLPADRALEREEVVVQAGDHLVLLGRARLQNVELPFERQDPGLARVL